MLQTFKVLRCCKLITKFPKEVAKLNQGSTQVLVLHFSYNQWQKLLHYDMVVIAF